MAGTILGQTYKHHTRPTACAAAGRMHSITWQLHNAVISGLCSSEVQTEGQIAVPGRRENQAVEATDRVSRLLFHV